MARRRLRWRTYQDRIDPRRLVFIDETWAKTNMAPLRGWCTRGRRLIAKVPHGHWKTLTFLAALRCDRIDAPCVIDGPINGESFLRLCRADPAADAGAWRHRHHGQSGLAQRPCRPRRHPLGRRAPPAAAALLARPQPDRAGRSPSSRRCCARPANAPSKPHGAGSATSRTLHASRMRKLPHQRRLCVHLN